MDFSGAILNGLITIVGYLAIFLGVYKLFQIAADIREIKELIALARRAPAGIAPLLAGAGPAMSSAITKDLLAEESAAAYAEHLLRAVNADSPAAESQPQGR